jgi:hypothetical protein
MVPRPKQGSYKSNGHNPTKFSQVEVPVKIISLAQKLSKIEG